MREPFRYGCEHVQSALVGEFLSALETSLVITSSSVSFIRRFAVFVAAGLLRCPLSREGKHLMKYDP